MVLESDKETLQTLISDTLTLLCKNGLSFQKQISVEALVGITLDTNDIILVNVNRLVQNEAEKSTVVEISTSKTQKKRKPTPKRKLPVNKTSGNVPGQGDGEPPAKVVVVMPSYSSGDHLVAEDDTTEMLLTGTVTTDHDYIKPELDLECADIDSSADTFVSPQVSPHADDADRLEVSGPGTSPKTTAATPKQTQKNPRLRKKNSTEEHRSDSTKPDNRYGPTPCELCGMIISTGNLRRHMNSHRGIYPYRCSECNKGYSNREALEGHMVHHTGIRKYECPHCHMKLAHKSSLTQHVKREHSAIW